MKICFYCDSIFTIGGVQRVLAVIAKKLSERGHLITILTQDDPNSENLNLYQLNQANITYKYINYPPVSPIAYLPCKTFSFLYKKKIIPQTPLTSQWYGYSSFPFTKRRKLIEELNSGTYDVIMGVHAFTSLQLASIRNCLKARKVIAWMHNSFDAFFRTPGFYLYEQANQFKHEMRKLDDIIVLSHYDKEMFFKQFNLFSKVIYNPLTITIQGKGNIDNKRFLTIGRMCPAHKGLDILIKAFALFSPNHPEWKLDIVGEGDEEESLKQLITAHQLEKQITIHPFTSHIQPHYANASVYILSSRWEGFPLVLAEAMSHRLPIIASQIPIVKELFKEKNNSLTFPKGNIEKLAEQMEIIANMPPHEIEKMCEASFNLATTLHISNIATLWESALVLENKKKH